MANFNIPPYFDDYDPDKGYHKILFRPSVAVQARELNQMQSILQKQIERFGSHIFKEGTIVLGGGFDIEQDVPYIKASVVTFPNASLQDFVGTTVIGQTSGIKAYVKAVEYDATNSNYVFMIRYLNSSETTSVFLNEEVVSVSTDSSKTFTVSASDATGFGSTFGIEAGVIFSKGYFVAFPKDTVIMDAYSITPSVTVGLALSEQFTTDLNDQTLLDNALGSPNENAPGAHRYAINITLSSIAYDADYNDEEFIPLFGIEDGIVKLRKERTEYARLYDELAKRTYDESGDYYVKGFNVRTREFLDTGDNEGVATVAQGGDSAYLSLDVEAGTAFVKGYEVNKLVTEHVLVPKATTYKELNNQLVNARSGGYFLIKEIVGSLEHDTAVVVNLYDTAETRITSDVKSSTAATGNQIGTAKLKSLVYESGTLGRAAATMRAYLFDFKMNDGRNISDVKSINYNSSPDYFFADVVLTNSKAKLEDTTNNLLLFPVGSEYIRTIRGNTGAVDTSFSFNRSETLSANLDATDAISTTVSTAGESLSYSTGELSSAEKRELILASNQDVDLALEGTVAINNGNNIVTGSSTRFDKLSSGDRLVFEGSTSQYYINTITSNTSMTLASNFGETTLTSNTFSKAIRTGDIFDLTANGSSGTQRTATVSSGSLNIDLAEYSTSTIGSIDTRLTYRVIRNTAAEAKKKLRANRFVKIDTSNNTANSVGPYNLGIPDVYQIRSIRMDTSVFANTTQGSNVTSSFTLDNGQRDNFYGHSTIRHTGSLDLTSKHLLVELDHFEPDFSGGYGYFSVDSYPIDDTNTSNTTIYTYEIPTYETSIGEQYNLRDVLDYRPVQSNTANSSVTVGSATTNPPTTNSFRTPTNGLRIAAIDSDISVDYSYYLARRDLVVLDKTGKFTTILGVPSVNPVSPIATGESMPVAKVFIPPYPSISETLGRKLNKLQLACISEKIAPKRFTMKEIGTINQRVNNLEYYSTINLLEKSALDLKILDADGLDRFKNGFFVDNFVNHYLGDTGNVDYKIAVDEDEGVIRPFFESEAFRYELDTNASSNYQVTGNIVTLPYTETSLIENKNVTTYRNVEKSVYRFIGNMELSPNTDNWVDTSTIDKNVDLTTPYQTVPATTMTTKWGSWVKNVTGYTVRYSGTSKTFSTYGAAKNFGASRGVSYSIDTLYRSTRSGVKTIKSYNSGTKVQDVGEFVTDVDIIPYIKPQTIKVYARNLKPNTRFYIFFDGEAMSDYLSPIDYSQNSTLASDPVICVYPPLRLYNDYNIDATQQIVMDTEGAEWKSDENGEIVGYLRLPETEKRFRTGTKEIRITDSPTDSLDASSYATSYFVANGLSVDKQNTIISSTVVTPQVQNINVIDQNSSKTTQNFYVPTVSSYGGGNSGDNGLDGGSIGGTWGLASGGRVTNQGKDVKSCMGYSFKIDAPIGEDGIFLTSADVWVQSIDPDLGVWFEIREMDNGGGITRTAIPGSEVWFKSSEVTTWDGSASTEETNKLNVKFPEPVFLMNDTQYAFIIHTEGVNPNYYFWISRLGETDILSGNQYTTRKLTGTLFTTNNNLNWDEVPDVDLKVRFNRAKFSVGTATVGLGNKPVELINLADSANTFQSGEMIKSAEFLSVSNTTSGANTIIVGDIITGVTSGISANVVSISGSKYYTDNFGFEVDEVYTVANSTSGDKSITGDITLVEFGIGQLRKYDSANNLMIIDDSNGLFASNVVIKGISSNNTNTIDTFDSYQYSVQTLKPYHLNFAWTSTAFENNSWLSDVASNAYSGYISTTPDVIETYFDEYTILSHSNEISKFGTTSPYSNKIKTTMVTSSEYVSPVLNLARAQSILVHNIINNDATNEDQPSGGNLLNKYISKITTLADGQDAEDLIVNLTAFRPIGTDVKVWAKMKPDEDVSVFRQQDWIELEASANVFSSSTSDTDFKELNYNIPSVYKDGNSVFQYVKNATPIVANTTGFDIVNNAILIANADTIFSANQQVYYMVPPGGTPLTPLAANTAYYVDTVNSSAITLKASYGGSTIDITDFRTDAEPEAHTIGGDVYSGFKQFSIKIGLMGEDSANPPRVGDLRVIALQV